eukprot:7382315-Prymnesium_polylepis.1
MPDAEYTFYLREMARLNQLRKADREAQREREQGGEALEEDDVVGGGGGGGGDGDGGGPLAVREAGRFDDDVAHSLSVKSWTPLPTGAPPRLLQLPSDEYEAYIRELARINELRRADREAEMEREREMQMELAGAQPPSVAPLPQCAGPFLVQSRVPVQSL